ncbi:hypothetical protein PHISP_01398 [Aspergillus sp. HF37]|nr:hypothetical protein PHISP_01398 [Aspergillus sp. HF37]
MASTSRKRSSAAAGDIDNDDSSKKAKTNTEKKPAATNSRQAGPAASSKVDANGDRYWEISKMRRATISTFRGKTMVNIREYYEKDGQELPGKKGISMPMDQFSSFITFLPEIEAVLSESGQTISRPNYAGVSTSAPDESDGSEEDSGGDLKDTASRKNIEATSDEDEEDE